MVNDMRFNKSDLIRFLCWGGALYIELLSLLDRYLLCILAALSLQQIYGDPMTNVLLHFIDLLLSIYSARLGSARLGSAHADLCSYWPFLI